CIEQLRFDRRSFKKLCIMLTNIGGLHDTQNMMVDEQVAMSLHILTHHVKNRVVKFRFKRSGETVSRHFKNVVNAIIRLQDHLLKNPKSFLKTRLMEYGSCLRLNLISFFFYTRCLGALDGTFVKVNVSSNEKSRYRTRKGEIATNVLAVCSPEMQFIYILSWWEGSAADSRVL
ncbi:LOW QUALITY PROTEIN: DDE_4 domain-containing protein, partial [Cephalotus follicularis]